MYKRIKALLKPSNASTSIKRLGKENRTKIFEKDILHESGHLRTQCELSWREALTLVAIYFLSSRTQCGDLSAMR